MLQRTFCHQTIHQIFSKIQIQSNKTRKSEICIMPQFVFYFKWQFIRHFFLDSLTLYHQTTVGCIVSSPEMSEQEEFLDCGTGGNKNMLRNSSFISWERSFKFMTEDQFYAILDHDILPCFHPSLQTGYKSWGMIIVEWHAICSLISLLTQSNGVSPFTRSLSSSRMDLGHLKNMLKSKHLISVCIKEK